MIEFFWGELFYSSAALNINLNTCDHACRYCYAKARRKSRKTNLAKIKKLVDGEVGGIMQQVYDLGYPVLMSNETDVLSRNNVREALAIIKLFSRRDTPMEILTKGGRREDEDALIKAMAAKRHKLLYVSITTADDETSKKVEPGAPPTSARLDLIRRAKAAGVEVEVGFNPWHEPWMPPDGHRRIIGGLLQTGVRMMFFNRLHLSNWQRDSQEMLSVMSKNEIEAVANRRRSPKAAMILEAHRMGAAAFELACPVGVDYFRLRREALGKAFPATGEFTAWAMEKFKAQSRDVEKRQPMDFTFTDFTNILFGGDRADLLTLDGRFAEFLILRNFAAYVGNPRNQKIRRFDELARLVWNDARFKEFTPQRSFIFNPIGEDEKGDVILRIDGNTYPKKRRRGVKRNED